MQGRANRGSARHGHTLHTSGDISAASAMAAESITQSIIEAGLDSRRLRIANAEQEVRQFEHIKPGVTQAEIAAHDKKPEDEKQKLLDQKNILRDNLISARDTLRAFEILMGIPGVAAIYTDFMSIPEPDNAQKNEFLNSLIKSFMNYNAAQAAKAIFSLFVTHDLKENDLESWTNEVNQPSFLKIYKHANDYLTSPAKRQQEELVQTIKQVLSVSYSKPQDEIERVTTALVGATAKIDEIRHAWKSLFNSLITTNIGSPGSALFLADKMTEILRLIAKKLTLPGGDETAPIIKYLAISFQDKSDLIVNQLDKIDAGLLKAESLLLNSGIFKDDKKFPDNFSPEVTELCKQLLRLALTQAKLREKQNEKKEALLQRLAELGQNYVEERDTTQIITEADLIAIYRDIAKDLSGGPLRFTVMSLKWPFEMDDFLDLLTTIRNADLGLDAEIFEAYVAHTEGKQNVNDSFVAATVPKPAIREGLFLKYKQIVEMTDAKSQPELYTKLKRKVISSGMSPKACYALLAKVSVHPSNVAIKCKDLQDFATEHKLPYPSNELIQDLAKISASATEDQVLQILQILNTAFTSSKAPPVKANSILTKIDAVCLITSNSEIVRAFQRRIIRNFIYDSQEFSTKEQADFNLGLKLRKADKSHKLSRLMPGRFWSGLSVGMALCIAAATALGVLVLPAGPIVIGFAFAVFAGLLGGGYATGRLVERAHLRWVERKDNKIADKYIAKTKETPEAKAQRELAKASKAKRRNIALAVGGVVLTAGILVAAFFVPALIVALPMIAKVFIYIGLVSAGASLFSSAVGRIQTFFGKNKSERTAKPAPKARHANSSNLDASEPLLANLTPYYPNDSRAYDTDDSLVLSGLTETPLRPAANQAGQADNGAGTGLLPNPGESRVGDMTVDGSPVISPDASTSPGQAPAAIAAQSIKGGAAAVIEMATPFRRAAAAPQASAGAAALSPVGRSDSVVDIGTGVIGRRLPQGFALDDSQDASRHYHI